MVICKSVWPELNAQKCQRKFYQIAKIGVDFEQNKDVPFPLIANQRTLFQSTIHNVPVPKMEIVEWQSLYSDRIARIFMLHFYGQGFLTLSFWLIWLSLYLGTTIAFSLKSTKCVLGVGRQRLVGCPFSAISMKKMYLICAMCSATMSEKKAHRRVCLVLKTGFHMNFHSLIISLELTLSWQTIKDNHGKCHSFANKFFPCYIA